MDPTAGGGDQGAHGSPGGHRDGDDRANKRQRAAPPACAIKLLIGKSAGSLIGKGGANIREIQTQSGATVRVSANGMYYPGTQERVVMVGGDLVDVKLAVALVLTRVHQVQSSDPSAEGGPSDTAPDPAAELVQKVLVPSSAGGLVIGRGGANIKALSEASGARLALASMQDGSMTMERVATIQGPLHTIQAAVQVLLDKLQEDETAAKYQNPSVNYREQAPMGGMPYGQPGGGGYGGGGMGGAGHGGYGMGVGGGGGGGYAPPQAPGMGGGYGMGGGGSGQGGAGVQVVGGAASGDQTTIPLAVPDSMVGVVVGKGGATIHELQALSGARITVSRRGEFVPGSNNRTVTIIGSAMAAQTAQHLITQKIQASMQMQAQQGLPQND